MYPPSTHELAQQRRELAPVQQAAFDAFGKAVFADGPLPAKVKQIIAVAVAHVTVGHCLRAGSGICGVARLRFRPRSVLPNAARFWLPRKVRAGSREADKDCLHCGREDIS